MSNLDLVSIPKIVERRFALAATKSRVSSSSLSKDRMGGEVDVPFVFWFCFNRLLRRSRLRWISGFNVRSGDASFTYQ